MDDSTARIELRRKSGPSLWAVVDLVDLERVQRHRWSASVRKHTTYVQTNVRRLDGRGSKIALHQFLMCPEPGLEVDHRDGDGLNNSRSNLRVATLAENRRNRRKHRPATSTYKGVHWDAQHGRWAAQIKRDGRIERLGFYVSEIDAAVAYDLRARELHQEFALVNFPDGITHLGGQLPA